MATSSIHRGFELNDGRTELRILFDSVEKVAFDSTGIGFFAAAPVAQQADISALTDDSGGTANNTLQSIGVTYNQTEVRNNFADLASQVNDIRTVLRNLGLMA